MQEKSHKKFHSETIFLMDILIERLKAAFNASNYKELSVKLGVKEGTIKTWVRRDSYDLKLIVSKCNPRINLNWLMTGEGPMLNQDTEDRELETGTAEDYEGNNSSNAPTKYAPGEFNLPFMLQENSDHEYRIFPDINKDAFIAYLDRKDRIIRELSEEVGKLKARLEQMSGTDN